MSKTLLIFRHEFRQALQRPAYIVMLLVIPLLSLLGIGLTKLVMLQLAHEARPLRMGFVDHSQSIRLEMNIGGMQFTRFENHDRAVSALIGQQIDEFIEIPENLVVQKQIRRYLRKKELIAPLAHEPKIKAFIGSQLLADKLEPALLQFTLAPLELLSVKISGTGEPETKERNLWNAIIPAVFSLLLMMALMFGASTLIRGLGEEKQSRLIEVLLSSVSMRQLLLGKVAALGLAGLIQVLVWLLSMPLLLKLAAWAFGSALNQIEVPAGFVILGMIYFILGYLLFAVFAVGVGAISADADEATQISMIYMMMGFIPLWFAGFLFNYPDSVVWDILAIFPVTAPIESMIRLGVAELPLWLILANISVLIVSIVAGMLLSLKLFKTYILMYGKRPTMVEIIRALRYK